MAVGSGQWAVGSWQLAVGSGQLAVGSWQLAVGVGEKIGVLRYLGQFLPFSILLGVIAGDPFSASADDEFFKKHVAPIFAARCLTCHNAVDKAGGFSLETADALLEHDLISPGDAANSQLIEAISGDLKSPPLMPKDENPLSNEEVDAIRKWVDAGAIWPNEFRISEPVVSDFDWWSLKPIQRPEVPAWPANSKEANWIRNPIDAFILKQQQANRLTFAPPADRRSLIRRVTYDLIGLSPSPVDIEKFIVDESPDAYEKLVERLLASPQYGERWARHWLDVARYADTCGYDKDKLRPNAWPYRDYVIRSINEDKPYSRFVEEQLAGDVLYPNTADGILGLGFIAAGPWDFIGHVEVPESKLDGQEARNLDRDEMASSTLNVFCSTTIQCARCHNHKFDPISQEQYYGLQAVFAAVDRTDREFGQDPEINNRRRALMAERQSLQQALAEIAKEIEIAGGKELVDLTQQLKELKAQQTLNELAPEYGYHSQVESTPDRSKWVEIDLGGDVEIAQILLRPCYDDFAGIGPGFGFPPKLTVSVRDGVGGTARVIENPLTDDFQATGLDPLVIDVSDRSLKVRTVRVTAEKLSPRSNDFIFALSELEVLDANGKNLALNAPVNALDSIEAPQRWSTKNLTDGLWPSYAKNDAPQKIAELNAQHEQLLKTLNTPERITRRLATNERLAKLDKDLAELPSGKMVYAASTEFSANGNFKPTNGKPRDVFVLHRGNVGQHGPIASPGTIPLTAGAEFRFALPPSHAEGDRRAALARWITDRENPLTWRSIVNRVWLYHFGQGLVDSPNDFGRMGGLPTHPELLDWLAVEFRDGRQSFRDLHRMIVTSSTYRQSSQDQAANSEIDANNRLLWRMNRRRLEAEEIRDSILAVSGRLNLEMGGPGYFLFDLQKTEHSPHYEYQLFDPNDAKTHRRSIYRFVVRSQPDPLMTTLDCADSSQSVAQRDETLTALQALSLLNNNFNLAMAERFAKSLEESSSEIAEQVIEGFQRVTGRKPNSEELEDLELLAKEQGMPNLCRVLLNLSEFVFVD